jgi:putative membrane protein
MKTFRIAAAMAALTLALPLAGAAEEKLSRGDQKFIQEAAQANMAEIQMGQVAQQQGASDQVRKLGEHIASDHRESQSKLGAIAGSHQVTLPAELSAQQKRELDKLSRQQGEAFDEAFVKQSISDHQKTVAMFRKAAREAKSEDVKRYASDNLPTLEEHLRRSQEGAAAEGKGAAMDGGRTAAESAGEAGETRSQ